MGKLLDIMALIFYCMFIYWLSAQQTLPTPQVFDFQDKVLHAGAYFVMSLLTWRCVRKQKTDLTQMPFLVSFGFCSFYGATDEWHQSFVAGRSSDVFDWLADTLGAGLAIAMLYKLRLKRAKECA